MSKRGAERGPVRWRDRKARARQAAGQAMAQPGQKAPACNVQPLLTHLLIELLVQQLQGLSQPCVVRLCVQHVHLHRKRQVRSFCHVALNIELTRHPRPIPCDSMPLLILDGTHVRLQPSEAACRDVPP